MCASKGLHIVRVPSGYDIEYRDEYGEDWPQLLGGPFVSPWAARSAIRECQAREAEDQDYAEACAEYEREPWAFGYRLPGRAP